MIDFKADHFFEPFLSRRFFESTGAVLVLPFFHGKKIVGCLFEFSDIDSPFDFSQTDFPIDTADEIGAFLLKSRERIGNIESNTLSDVNDIFQHSEIIISQAKKEEKRVLFFIIDLTPIINQLARELQYIDLFYLKKDLQYTISQMGAESGFCGLASENRIVLGIKAKHSHSQTVMMHQIRQLLLKQCNQSDTVQNVNILTRIWPDDNTNVRSLLSDFFSDVE